MNGRRVSSFGDLKDAGDFYWELAAIDDKPVRVWFVCQKCKTKHQAPVKPWNPDGWDFDGNLDAPTLSPSIWMNRDEQCGWHGFLEHGVWRSV